MSNLQHRFLTKCINLFTFLTYIVDFASDSAETDTFDWESIAIVTCWILMNNLVLKISVFVKLFLDLFAHLWGYKFIYFRLNKSFNVLTSKSLRNWVWASHVAISLCHLSRCSTFLFILLLFLICFLWFSELVKFLLDNFLSKLHLVVLWLHVDERTTHRSHLWPGCLLSIVSFGWLC